jgi:hypothetical protein
MDGPDSASYREWDKKDRDVKWFAHGRTPSERLRTEVRPLSVEYAERLWRWVFQSKAKEDVIPLIAKNPKGWLAKLYRRSEPQYFGGTQAPPLSVLLHRHFKWAASETVFFLTRSGTGYQTRWAVFVKDCEWFLGWYDEGILFHPTAREVAIFWEDSAMYVGQRGERKLRLPEAKVVAG